MTGVTPPPAGMIAAGYMAKKIAKRPDFIKTDKVEDIYSVCSCISANFADYIGFWKHNGWWLFDSPDIIRRLARDKDIDLSGARFFYYEVFEREYAAEDKMWYTVDREHSLPTDVHIPKHKTLEGYDVVTFSAASDPEHSPLSCNSLAKKMPANRHCLFNSFDEAQKLLEAGKFSNSEPGPFRIFAVYSLPENLTSSA